MMRTKMADQWLTSKYGKNCQLWECCISLKNFNGDSCGQFKDGENINFQYTYVK